MRLSKEIELRIGSSEDLARYVLYQLRIFMPADQDEGFETINRYLPGTLKRMAPILACAKHFQPGIFDHLNSQQYAMFLYLLANEIWTNDESSWVVCEKLFFLNRIFSGMDLYYKINMPEIFLIEHGGGSVLVNTHYGNKFVFFQSVTVGRLGDACPVIGEGVILFPNTVVTGESIIGDYSVISAGTIVNNKIIPPDSVVFSNGSDIVIKDRKKDYLSYYFR
ncbi:MAG: hypothetical protein CSYNP_00042 [Syntrophus sp. SKADARSKE-3]|nr:hypothetical protein [Syntrophus sp. SKADARSKE-3]